MSYKFKGILSFPVLTQQALANKQARDPNIAKYGCTLIFLPGDSQIEDLKKVLATEIANGYPNGFPASAKSCIKSYDERYAGKDYYDDRFSGSYTLSMSAKPEDFSPSKHVVDMQMQPILDPTDIQAGKVVWVNCGISKYTGGTGGIGGWLNGVMVTDEEPPMGILGQGAATVDQMFHGVNVAAPKPAARELPSVATPPPPVSEFIMTDKANGASREQFHQQGWTDEALLENGYMMKPSFA